MRIALVHDDLIQHGGAERLLLALHELWPNAPIYTSVASKEWIEFCLREKIHLKTSFMQRLPFAVRLNRVYSLFFMHVLAFESFDFDNFDLVISMSSRYAHGIITKPRTTHICYMNSPGRMFWEPTAYFRFETFGFLQRFKKIFDLIVLFPLTLFKMWDFSAAQRIDYIIANSITPQNRIKKYYQRDSVIIYPYVDKPEMLSKRNSQNVPSYYLVISRLVSWKRIDIAIKACEELGLKLKIVGNGPASEELKLLAGTNTEFLGYVSEDEKNNLIANCTAVINPQYEDFGIVPLEAMIRGKPVIAFGKGGVLETVIPKKTGELFYEQSTNSLKEALLRSQQEKYLVNDCVFQAVKFEKRIFMKKMKDFVNTVYLSGES